MLQLKNFRLQIYDIEYPFVKSLRIKDFITPLIAYNKDIPELSLIFYF